MYGQNSKDLAGSSGPAAHPYKHNEILTKKMGRAKTSVKRAGPLHIFKQALSFQPWQFTGGPVLTGI